MEEKGEGTKEEENPKEEKDTPEEETEEGCIFSST
jgi:hypothetical protein